MKDYIMHTVTDFYLCVKTRIYKKYYDSVLL